jgi:hypothetical protein
MGSQGWIIGPPGQATPPPVPEDSSVDLGKGWKVAPQPSAAALAPVGGSTAGGRADTSGAPSLPKGLDYPRFRPGQSLPEDAEGDEAPFWDTAEQRQAAEAYNRQLDAWKAKAPTQPGPQILAEEPNPPKPPGPGAPLSVYTRTPGTQTYTGPRGTQPVDFSRPKPSILPAPAQKVVDEARQKFGLGPFDLGFQALDNVAQGLSEIGDMAKAASPEEAARQSKANRLKGETYLPEGLNQLVGGTGKVVKGGLEIGSVLIPYAAMQAPIRTVATLAGYDLASEGAKRALEAAGAKPDYAELGGNLAGLGVGGAVAKVSGLFGPGGMFGQGIDPTSLTDHQVMYGYQAARQAGDRPKMEIFGQEGIRRQGAYEADRMATAQGLRPGAPAPESAPAPPPPSPPPSPAQPVEPTPAPPPTDLGEGWTSNPIEDAIAEQRAAAIQERRANSPQPPAASANQPPAAATLAEEKPNVPPEFLPAPVAQQPQTVSPSEGGLDLGKGWKAAPEPPEPQQPEIPKEFLPAPSQKPVAGPDVPTAASGKAAEVYTITGRKVGVQYDIRDASELTNSFRPGYPQEYQPRNTDRVASRARVDQRKGDMNFALMADSRLASDGAPITLPDGTTITRNHGTQALKELYAEGSPRAAAYKQDLIDHAADYGDDPQRVAAIPNPVLTRVITDAMKPADVAQFAEEANMSSAARMSDAEVAAVLSRRMTGPLMDSFEPKEDGTPNPEFVRELIKGLPVEEQGVFMDASGKLSQTGARIVRNTVFAKAYPDPRALERMAESENPSLKNITAGMLQAAPKVAQFQEAVSRGDRFDVGLGQEISDAAAVLDNLHREGTPVKDWMAQGDLAGQERDPVAEKLVQIFADNRKSAKKIGEVLKEYSEVAHEAGSPKQDSMFGPPAPLSKADILETAYERAKQRWEPQKDLFGDKAAVQPPGEPGERGVAPRENAPEGPQRGPGEARGPARAAEPEQQVGSPPSQSKPSTTPTAPRSIAEIQAEDAKLAAATKNMPEGYGKIPGLPPPTGKYWNPATVMKRRIELMREMRAVAIQAIREGNPVPPEVLAEYPDLLPKASPAAPFNASRVPALQSHPVPKQGGPGDNPLEKQPQTPEGKVIAVRALDPRETPKVGEIIGPSEAWANYKPTGLLPGTSAFDARGDLDRAFEQARDWHVGYWEAHRRFAVLSGEVVPEENTHSSGGRYIEPGEILVRRAKVEGLYEFRDGSLYHVEGANPLNARRHWTRKAEQTSEPTAQHSPAAPFNASRVPRLSTGRNAIYSPNLSADWHARHMQFEEHPLDPEDAKHAVAYVTNPSGIEYISRLAGQLSGAGALHLAPGDAGKVAALARSSAAEYTTPPQSVLNLIDAATRAAVSGKSLIVVGDHEGATDETKTAALREELDHAAQSRLAGGRSANRHLSEANASSFVAGSAEGNRATAALSRYQFESAGEAAAEVGARLMQPQRYQQLDLSHSEARSLGARYVRELRREHGSVKPREIAKRVISALRRGPEGSGGKPGEVPGRLRPGGRGRTGAGNKPDTSAFRNATGADYERQPRDLLPAGNAAGENPEGSLFGPEAERQSQVDNQHGENRLLHDQLTAQINSGLAKGPSKLKPAKNRSLFDEDGPEQGALFNASRLGSERGSFSLKQIQKTPEQVNAEAEKRYGKNEVWHYTGQRDLWSARVRQITGRLRREIPSAVDREGLYLMRDSRIAPGQMEQWLAGTHMGYMTVPDVTIGQENIRKLKPSIERALNPTPAMLKADKELTAIAEVSLREGQKLGFIEEHVSPDEYVTHLLQPAEEKEGAFDKMGRALGGKIGRNFPYNQEREFPTILEAIANNQRPRTLDPFKAFEVYGDKFATARATHMLLQHMGEADTGRWGVKGGENIPKGWVEMAPHAQLFQNGAERFFVAPKVEKAFQPITDPDYLNRVTAFRLARNYQIFTKAAQLSMSFFHATAETAMALGNMGPTGYWKALKADRFSREFERQEAWYIGHGLTTAIQKSAPGMEEGLAATGPLTVSSLPTPSEAFRSLPVIRQVDQTAHAITSFTFENQQRRFKVTDMAIHEAGWIARHPGATRDELDTALRSMAKEVNAVYGGLHWENLGVNKMTLNFARVLQLAPDWWWSNILNAKYTFEGGTPAGKMARMFWLRTLTGGMIATQLASLMFSGKPSKRPTQVYMGTDKDGNDVYQNIFLRGAAGQLANTLGNIIEYGGIEGPLRTIGQSAGPGLRAWNESQKNETFLGREIAPKGMNPLASTARGVIEMGKSLVPFPWSFANAWEMLAGPDADKYQNKELLTTLFAGTPPQHVKPSKPPGTARDIWDQIKTGRVNESKARASKSDSVIEHMKREQRKLLHP